MCSIAQLNIGDYESVPIKSVQRFRISFNTRKKRVYIGMFYCYKLLGINWPTLSRIIADAYIDAL